MLMQKGIVPLQGILIAVCPIQLEIILGKWKQTALKLVKSFSKDRLTSVYLLTLACEWWSWGESNPRP